MLLVNQFTVGLGKCITWLSNQLKNIFYILNTVSLCFFFKTIVFFLMKIYPECGHNYAGNGFETEFSQLC